MRRLRRMALASAALLVLTASSAAAASATPGPAATFSGSCSFSGPVSIGRPITLVPVPGAQFSYAGAGTCSGTLDGAAVAAAPLTVTFTNVQTLFDTCELGPDVNLSGEATVGAQRFEIVVNLVRAAVAGPFVLSTGGGGLALGTAQFTPAADPVTAVTQCLSQGVAAASLSATFNTITPLVGLPQGT
jgi:hypothetical protein